MVTSCCVPECKQKGKKTPTGEKVSFFEFPRSPLRRKQWIHAIRREEGKEFKIVHGTKVCSLHFRREDVRKSSNGRTCVAAGCVLSRFAWSVPFPKKRKAPPKRHPLPPKKKLLLSESTSTASNSKSNRNAEPNDTYLEFNARKKDRGNGTGAVKPSTGKH